MSEKVNGITVSVTVGNGGSPGLAVDVAGMSEREVRKYVDERIEDALSSSDETEEPIYGEFIGSATMTLTGGQRQDTGIVLPMDGNEICFVVKCESAEYLEFEVGDYDAGNMGYAYKTPGEAYVYLRPPANQDDLMLRVNAPTSNSDVLVEVEVYTFNSASLPDTPVILWSTSPGYEYMVTAAGLILIPLRHVARYNAIEIVCRVSTDSYETVSNTFPVGNLLALGGDRTKYVSGIYGMPYMSQGKLWLNTASAKFQTVFSTYSGFETPTSMIVWMNEVKTIRSAVGTGAATNEIVSTDEATTMRPIMVVGYK